MKCDNHLLSDIDACTMVSLKSVDHANGRLTVAENTATAPFNIRRVYFVYDVPAGAERGGHSHHDTAEMVVALAGAFDITVDDGCRTRRITLNRPDCGLLLPPGIWRTLDNFSAGAICLVLASEPYDEADYVRDFDSFRQLTARKR